MATESKTSVRMTFVDSLGSGISKTFTGINPSVQDSDLQAFSSAIVANKEIYPIMPVTAKTIQLITTTTRDVALV